MTAHVVNIGRLEKGECVNRRIITNAGCKIKMVMALFGDQNSAKIQKKVVRDTTDFNGTLTAKFDGFLTIATFAQIGVCAIRADDTFSILGNC